MSINKDLLGLDSQDTRRRSHPRIQSPINSPLVPVASISGSQSLNASSAAREPISTGLARLDAALDDSDQQRPGILRGQVTEVFGPPGVGKTSLA